MSQTLPRMYQDSCTIWQAFCSFFGNFSSCSHHFFKENISLFQHFGTHGFKCFLLNVPSMTLLNNFKYLIFQSDVPELFDRECPARPLSYTWLKFPFTFHEICTIHNRWHWNWSWSNTFLPKKSKIKKFECSQLLEGDGIKSRLPLKIYSTLITVNLMGKYYG